MSSFASIFNSLIAYLRSLLFSKHLEICVVGLQSAGKTSLVNLLSSGQFADEMVPTVGFNMRKVRSGNTTIKVWDIGGQPRFRNMWERYCRGVSAIVFVVETPPSSDPWAIATEELHALIERPHLAGVPLLVLATKNDIKGAVGVDQVIRTMRLDTISNREVSCYSISSKNQVNIDVTLRWLVARSPAGSR
ncbi:P-loop containing nucleoside triphosphate hydrolase protein [Violaceomyces palustris]|uniref:P-loop containing nucleoside triphosphate hydrolase protein n=1 Tax=Violaceomyces palustris TaxID=1673888 RepID=A0ACD0NLP5_9BASI|nr:P-loop containing nucleoside triphosphate hydrolase protein [Violaceomyces palustris]